MWIVRIALERPYTFVVLALLILIFSPVVIQRTPVDIFPNINIPVIAVAWQYAGLNPEELEGRLTSVYERILTTTVDNVEHIESTTVNGQAVVKIFLQPGTSLDTANAQVTAISQTILRQLPPGALPPLIINYSASSVPILQLGLSGKGLSEQQLNDMGQNFIRPQLVPVAGAVVPYPYGGKQRQVMIDLNTDLLEAKGLSPQDVLNALTNQNLVLPGGTAKIDEFEYDVRVNASPRTVAELNTLPIKQVGNSTVYLQDVANVRDGFAPQTNIVRQDGHRGVLLSILKAGTASTISVVQGSRDLLPRIAQTLPPELKIQPLADQSIFVKAAISGVIREALIAACLTALMILLFLGSWRSTLIIAVSIPLSILTSVIILSALGQTINIMTLGGFALAVGILVDDATVEIENIERNLAQGKEIKRAILDGASQIAVPAFVSTLCICIVFLPMFFLAGVSKFLFVPLAEAVVFAMLASYFFSRTIVPTMALYLLKSGEHHVGHQNVFSRFQASFERGFQRLRLSYQLLLTTAVHRRAVFIPAFLLVCLSVFLLVPWLGQNFFPGSDNGQFILHVRAKSGTRIEETARICDLIEAYIRQQIPSREVDNILDNIGLPYSAINYMHSTSGLIGTADADIMVSLKEKHRPTPDYVRDLRKTLPRNFPGVTFYFLPADMVTQVLNFGLPAPIDIQIDGADIDGNRQVAERTLADLRRVPGLTDLRIQQQFDYPTYDINVDRTKAGQGGLNERSVVTSVLNSLSGSFQITPMFFLNWKNGVNYNLVAQTPQYKVRSLQDLANTPITATDTSRPGILANVASVTRSTEMEAISHYNIRRIVEIYGAVQDRDLGSAARDIDRIVEANRKSLPRGSFITIRGQIQTMRSSYVGLLAGLGFSIVLVYLLIVVNFQSWLDPFIIITALPAALAGIVLFLFITHTTLSVPALMGAIMCMGVATANSILVVSFAKDQLLHHGDPIEAAIEAGYTRFRPVIMTALAMIIGMVPMALGLGDGGEQNAPLGRAVIGGLLCATVATLVFVPSVFSLLHRRHAESDPSVSTEEEGQPIHA
ncbi:MAG TPA: efflux RND transporter permease subunit [Candidatus Polarisedimenticolia bacterium]|nr:efflux RND transporter permease subunit [Candidatus Polarisedimenticolia bacterium]